MRRYSVVYARAVSKKRKFDGTLVCEDVGGGQRVRVVLKDENGDLIDEGSVLAEQVVDGGSVTLSLHLVDVGEEEVGTGPKHSCQAVGPQQQRANPATLQRTKAFVAPPASRPLPCAVLAAAPQRQACGVQQNQQEQQSCVGYARTESSFAPSSGQHRCDHERGGAMQCQTGTSAASSFRSVSQENASVQQPKPVRRTDHAQLSQQHSGQLKSQSCLYGPHAILALLDGNRGSTSKGASTSKVPLITSSVSPSLTAQAEQPEQRNQGVSDGNSFTRMQTTVSSYTVSSTCSSPKISHSPTSHSPTLPGGKHEQLEKPDSLLESSRTEMPAATQANSWSSSGLDPIGSATLRYPNASQQPSRCAQAPGQLAPQRTACVGLSASSRHAGAGGALSTNAGLSVRPPQHNAMLRSLSQAPSSETGGKLPGGTSGGSIPSNTDRPVSRNRGFAPPRPRGREQHESTGASGSTACSSSDGRHLKLSARVSHMKPLAAPGPSTGSCSSVTNKSKARQLVFPNSDQSFACGYANLAGAPRAALRRTYDSLSEYQTTMKEALQEQVNLQLADLARNFYECRSKPSSQQRAMGIGLYKAKLIRTRGKGNEHPQRTSDQARSQGRQRRTLQQQDSSEALDQNDDSSTEQEDDRGEAAVIDGDQKLFLKLDFSGGREPSSAFSADDVWLLALRPDEMHSAMFVRSLWHGPTSSGTIEVQEVQAALFSIRTGMQVVALRGPNTGDFFDQIKVLEGLRLPQGSGVSASPPILPALLMPLRSVPSARLDIVYQSGATPDVDGLLQQALERFRPNQEQEGVLRHIADWLRRDGIDNKVQPIVSVHGVFGAGKSHLLVCALWFLQRALRGARKAGRSVKVLFAALTNVAVDNVIGGLLRHLDDGEAEPDVVRVGSVRRIAAAVLPYSTHGKLLRADEVATRQDLERELKSSHSSAERAAIQQAVALIDSGRMATRARTLHKFTIVGATCAATGLACMAGLKFDFVLLDECSQLTEPASLLPLYRSSCERLLVVGDPMQLPPTLLSSAPSGSSGVNPPSASKSLDLTFTLFQRLANGGIPPVLLSAQYALDQADAQSHLLSGMKFSRMHAHTFAGLPTIGFAHVSGNEQTSKGVSTWNISEAMRVTRIVGSLAGSGIEPEQIGCVCMYRAQSETIRKMLEEAGLMGVTVSTVDAFQGAERDVILVTTCRTSLDGPLSFIANPLRLNVTITRARHHLLIIGHADVLQSLSSWATILDEAEAIPTIYTTGHGEVIGDDDLEVPAQRVGVRSTELLKMSEHSMVNSEEHAAAFANIPATHLNEESDAATELDALMAARRHKIESIKDMEAKVHSDVAAEMDVGIRVNPALAAALAARHPCEEMSCQRETTASARAEPTNQDGHSPTLHAVEDCQRLNDDDEHRSVSSQLDVGEDRHQNVINLLDIDEEDSDA